MPHVSHYKLSQRVESELIKTLEITLAKLTKEEEIQGFLFSLLSPTERLMLAKRFTMTILLKEGIPESQIAESLHVTLPTVSRMQLFLETHGKGYDIALEKLKQEKAMQELKKILFKIAGYAIRASGGYIKKEIF